MKNKLIKLKTLVNKNVFVPTGTSDLLIEASVKIIKPNKTILDLGCGNGIVGISISKIKNLKKKNLLFRCFKFSLQKCKTKL